MTKIELKKGENLSIKFNEGTINVKLDFTTNSKVKIYTSNKNESVIKIIDIKTNQYKNDIISDNRLEGKFEINLPIKNNLNYLHIECLHGTSNFSIDDFINYPEYEKEITTCKYVRTIAEYLNSTYTINKKLTTMYNKSEPMLYRGHSSVDYKLESTLHRIRKYEQKVELFDYLWFINQFKTNINIVTNENFKSIDHNELKLITKDIFNINEIKINEIKKVEKDYITFLRHYGFPSPYIDVTTNPLIALYMALEKYEEKSSTACVLILKNDSNLRTASLNIDDSTMSEPIHTIDITNQEINTKTYRHIKQQSHY